MKSMMKILLAGAVAVMAIAVSAAPSEAAKKKKGPAAGAFIGQVCSTGCGKDNLCKTMVWTLDKKWSPALWPACAKPFCPPAC